MKLHVLSQKITATLVLAPLAFVLADPIVYTVTTSGANATNLLAEATVEIDDNGTVSTANFADVTFVADSIFRKRGEGFLKSCSGMSDFTGEVRIEEGALILDDVGQLGRTVDGATTDPLVVVSNGASLVVAYDGLPADDSKRNKLCLCGGIRIAGTGYQDIGAVRSDSTQRLRYLFSSGIMLLDNATIVNASRASASDDKDWGTKSGITCNLNTHTLTVKGLLLRNYQMTFSNPGHIVVAENSQMQFYSYNKIWGGTEDNTLTVKSGGVIDIGGSNSMLQEPWTLVLEDGARIMSTTSNSKGNIDKYFWAGPVLLKGRAIIDNDGNTKGIALLGPVSGSGGFELGRGGIELVSPDNSFAGGVRAAMLGNQLPTLGLWSGTALPSPLTATNSNLSLPSPVVYQLPELSFHASSGKTLSAAGGAGGTVASLVKTGPGMLELTAPLAVTGGVTLAGGTLRLSSEMSTYSPAPGLIESRLRVADKTEGSSFRADWYTNGTAMNTNRLVSLPELANQHYEAVGFAWVRGGCEFVRYKGYVWNRSDHNVTWTVAIAICPQSLLYIDNAETPLIKRTTTNWKTDGLALQNVTLTPGPHLFDLRMYSEGYDKPGARGDGFTNWPNNYGFVIDFEGRGTVDAANYSIPSNNVWSVLPGGDGSLFTIDARDSDDITGDNYTRASFPFLDATPGTTLDLNAAGCTFTVQELSGITAVTNGSLHVAKKWTLSNEALAAGRPLTGDAKISFAAGWTLSIPDLGEIRAPNERVLAVASGGGLTLPAVFDRGSDATRRWHLELSADGTRLSMVRSGFMVSFR